MNAMNESLTGNIVLDTENDDMAQRVLLSLPFVSPLSPVTILFQVAGTALVIGAAAMWILPGSDLTAEMVLMKFGSSLFLFLCGLALLMRNHNEAQPRVYFDPVRREVRVLKKNNHGRPETILQRRYDQIGTARFGNRSVEFWDLDGGILMRLNLRDGESRGALRAQLTGLINIA